MSYPHHVYLFPDGSYRLVDKLDGAKHVPLGTWLRTKTDQWFQSKLLTLAASAGTGPRWSLRIEYSRVPAEIKARALLL